MKMWTTAHRPRLKEILAQSARAGASPRPSTNMSKGMFDRYPFAQASPSLWGLLALT
jgi:hypothetical protein